MEIQEALISVLIPVYNVENYLDECLQSIVGQTYGNLEILLADDGSTDNSPAKCDEWATRDSRIKVYHRENAGVSATRNFLVKHAAGEYICFVDSDDYIEKNFVEKLYILLQENNADMAGCRFKRDKQGEIIYPTEDCSYTFTVDRMDYLKRMYSNISGFVAPWGRLVRREVYSDVSYPEGKVHEDGYTAREIAMNCNIITWTQEALYYYRYNDRGITSSFSVERMEYDLGWIDADISYFNENGNMEFRAITEKVYCYRVLEFWKIMPRECKKKYGKTYTVRAFHILCSRGNSAKAKLKYLCMIPYVWVSSVC